MGGKFSLKKFFLIFVRNFLISSIIKKFPQKICLPKNVGRRLFRPEKASMDAFSRRLEKASIDAFSGLNKVPMDAFSVDFHSFGP